LITDGVALVHWALYTAKIPPERIVILGQSLGTAVASAVALEFADPTNGLNPGRDTVAEQSPLLEDGALISKPTTFAGIVLVASFFDLPTLMLTYRMGGLIPLLLPLRPFPAFAMMLTSRMADRWQTGVRLEAYYNTFASNTLLLQGSDGRTMGSVQLIHGLNDRDISYHQTEIICRQVLGEGSKCVDGSEGNRIVDVHRKDRPQMRFELFGHGGEIFQQCFLRQF
jgi:abhydrolase domain-containing protein 12